MRVRSSAAASRRSRSASRAAPAARSSRPPIRSRRWRTRSPSTQAPPHTTVPNSSATRGKVSWPTPEALTWIRKSPITTAAVTGCRSCAEGCAATKNSATVGPSGGPGA